MKYFAYILLLFLCFTTFSQNAITSTITHENLGSNVNSYAGEISPIISSDGKTLYFVRDGHSQNKAGQDIWFSTLNEDGNWNPATHPKTPLNQGYNSGVFNISTDNNQLLVRGAYVDGEYESSGLSIVTKNKKGEWNDPEKLEIKNFSKYSSLGKYNGSFLSTDGKTILMYFADDANGGNSDIYVSHLILKDKWAKPKSAKDVGKFISKTLKNNTWTEPEKIGNLNTKEFDETAPFLAADGYTLYYSSNRTGTLGSNDIWMSKRLDSTWKKWSEPINLGTGINTIDWDCYYTLDARGEQAYMVSWKNSLGAADIVKIKLSKEVRPNPVVLISGKVYNAKTKEPIGANIEYENLMNGKNTGIATSNPQTGEYKIVLPYGINYGFMAFAEKHIAISDNIDLSTIAEYKEITRDLYLVPLEVGSTIRLNNIFFDFGKATLRSESFPEIDRLIVYMHQNSNMEIELSGHTDNVGGKETNLKLSDDRAKAVTAYLVANGVKENRIKTIGYGETKPISSNETEEGKQLNRRVEFTILKN